MGESELFIGGKNLIERPVGGGGGGGCYTNYAYLFIYIGLVSFYC